MRLHENWELFSEALQAASQPVEDGGLGIKSIFIEKDYWICRSLSLMAANDKDNRAIFKGGTSLTKAYGIGSRFSEDIDIAISEAWTLRGNQLKMLIKRTAKSMTEGLQEINMPGFTSKGSHYHKAYYSYPRAIDTLQVGAIKAGQLLVKINSFANPYPFQKCKLQSFLTEFLQKTGNENLIEEKYDFFSTVFEYIVSDYNKDSGKYGEYFTPHAVATIMARLLVSPDETIHSAATCDPTAGTGTLVMALAHQIGESNCSIFTQDQSQKSTTMLRLNLILNNLVSSLPNVIQGDSLIDWGHERKDGTFDKMFDYVVSNPPFKEDFSQTVTNAAFKNTDRFFAGIPNVPKGDKQKMEIYLVFIQHILYILKDTGKAAVVVPTGFLTASAKIPLAIRKKMVDKGWLRGVVSMPSNIFANTGTNVSVVFIDKGKKDDKVILIDASKLGTTEKVDKNQRTVLSAADEDKIANTFRSMEDVDDFSKVVSLDEIKEKKYSFSAGQYFDIKIDYVDITEEEFNRRMSEYKSTLAKQFEESHKLEEEIMKQLASLKFNEDVKEE